LIRQTVSLYKILDKVGEGGWVAFIKPRRICVDAFLYAGFKTAPQCYNPDVLKEDFSTLLEGEKVCFIGNRTFSLLTQRGDSSVDHLARKGQAWTE
jgi:hypothetical protein